MLQLSVGAFKPRAQRFCVRGKLRYRPCETGGWQEGTTENISSSGLLFRSKNPLNPGEQIQMIITMPAEKGEERPRLIACLARVLRAELCGPREASYLVAARLLNYEFVKRDP